MRDEYLFDYRHAKPNRFARGGRPDGTLPAPAPTDLSDEHKVLLEALYAALPLSVDELPYSPEMEQLHHDFVERAGKEATIREVYKALKNLGRQGRLGGKFFAPAPAAE